MQPSDADIPDWARTYEGQEFAPWAMTVDLVAMGCDAAAGDLQVLVVDRRMPPFERTPGLPGGFVDWGTDDDARATALRIAAAKAEVREVPDLAEVGVYDRQGRDPRQFAGHTGPDGTWVATGVRIVSRAFLALLRPDPHRWMPEVRWASVYRFLPWEDQRDPARRATTRRLLDLLTDWAQQGGREAKSRLLRAHGLFERETWNPEEVRARWDLLMEARLVEEAWRDRWGRPRAERPRMLFGETLAFDHREMLADALAALRGRLRREPRVADALTPEEFRISELQTVFESVGGQALVRSNFRRLVADRRIAEPTGEVEPPSGPGKPAGIYRVPETLRETRTREELTLPWQRNS